MEENKRVPSKKRVAGREISKDDPGLEDDDCSEPEMGTFKRASEDVIANRRIIKARRLHTQTQPLSSSSNPFAKINLIVLADTILKFREPFDKAENGDPEKIRREKEEYERRKKRDKAKIQAEAKAAEEACRQSEAAIAAEAKKKREAAREAARQALLRVEKTVEINGSSEFLNDLEILRTVSAPVGEHQHQLIASSINDTNLDPSQDCIGGRFMLGGNNPLEQLGLYIKEEEEEEEEENENVDVANVDRLDPSNTNSHIINDNGSIDENSVNNDNSTKNINGTNKSSSNNSSNAGGREVGDVDG